jgi:hypothetical protein
MIEARPAKVVIPIEVEASSVTAVAKATIVVSNAKIGATVLSVCRSHAKSSREDFSGNDDKSSLEHAPARGACGESSDESIE